LLISVKARSFGSGAGICWRPAAGAIATCRFRACLLLEAGKVYHLIIMQHEDFDVASLAAYLHLDPQQVDRLANRGKLPARRVGGKWRFSPAEIHHWMEKRLGLLDDAELAQVETAMEKRPVHEDEEVELTIESLLSVELISPLLPARTKGSVITSMAELATMTGLLWDADKMAEAIRAREDMQSTAMDNGVALLHPRRPLPSILGGPVLAFGRCGQGIPFGGSRQLTDLFWLIGSIDDRMHLRILARISRLLATEGLLDQLREAADAVDMRTALCEAEANLK
jgi:PTS system nitrogen regulatory IIA component